MPPDNPNRALPHDPVSIPASIGAPRRQHGRLPGSHVCHRGDCSHPTTTRRGLGVRQQTASRQSHADTAEMVAPWQELQREPEASPRVLPVRCTLLDRIVEEFVCRCENNAAHVPSSAVLLGIRNLITVPFGVFGMALAWYARRLW